MPRVIVSVTNDLTTDNRVDKVCRAISATGFDVLLVGRMRQDSLVLSRNYTTKRFKLFFDKGALFYAEYNLRLFFFLLVNKYDVLHANDLDTLLANTLASVIRRKPLVYDSHEYFTETPELVARPVIQRIWAFIEGKCFYIPVAIFTVNQSIAELFKKKYGRKLHVMRNIPEKEVFLSGKSRADLGLTAGKKILVLQGSGINVDRGAEEFLEVIAMLDDTYLWMIIGNGDIVPQLKSEVSKRQMSNKLLFLPKMPYREMMEYTQHADLGLTLDKPTNINYLYSLPNKLFDYIRVGVPVFASALVEVSLVVNDFQVGWIFPNHNPTEMAKQIEQIFADQEAYNKVKGNLENASELLCWENEVVKLQALYKEFYRYVK